MSVSVVITAADAMLASPGSQLQGRCISKVRQLAARWNRFGTCKRMCISSSRCRKLYIREQRQRIAMARLLKIIISSAPARAREPAPVSAERRHGGLAPSPSACAPDRCGVASDIGSFGTNYHSLDTFKSARRGKYLPLPDGTKTKLYVLRMPDASQFCARVGSCQDGGGSTADGTCRDTRGLSTEAKSGTPALKSGTPVSAYRGGHRHGVSRGSQPAGRACLALSPTVNKVTSGLTRP